MGLNLNPALSLIAKWRRVSHSPGFCERLEMPFLKSIQPIWPSKARGLQMFQGLTYARRQMHTVPLRRLKVHLLHRPTEGVHRHPVKSNSEAPRSVSRSLPLLQLHLGPEFPLKLDSECCHLASQRSRLLDMHLSLVVEGIWHPAARLQLTESQLGEGTQPGLSVGWQEWQN